MVTRVVLVIALWAAVVVGAIGLFGGAAAPLGFAAAGVGVLVGGSAAVRAAAARGLPTPRRRPPAPAVVPGSRRVPLAEAGIVLPD